MIKTKYVRTNKRKVFKEYYLLGSFLSFFAIFGALGVTYRDRELNRTKWRGTLLGGMQLPVLFLLWKGLFISLFKAPADISVLALAVMGFAYFIYLIVFCIKYVTE